MTVLTFAVLLVRERIYLSYVSLIPCYTSWPDVFYLLPVVILTGPLSGAWSLPRGSWVSGRLPALGSGAGLGPLCFVLFCFGFLLVFLPSGALVVFVCLLFCFLCFLCCLFCGVCFRFVCVLLFSCSPCRVTTDWLHRTAMYLGFCLKIELWLCELLRSRLDVWIWTSYLVCRLNPW